MSKPHPDTDDLIADLIGERPLPAADQAHVEGCRDCGEVQRVLRAGRAALDPNSTPRASATAPLEAVHEVDAATLVAFVGGGLAASEGQRVEAHLASCALCRDEVEALREDQEVWHQALAGPAPVALAPPRPATGRRARGLWLGAGVLALAATTLLVVTGRGPGAGEPGATRDGERFPAIAGEAQRGDVAPTLYFDATVITPGPGAANRVRAELVPTRTDAPCQAGDVVVLDVVVSTSPRSRADDRHALFHTPPGGAPTLIGLDDARTRAAELRRGGPDEARPGYAVELGAGAGTHTFTAVVAPSPIGDAAWLARAQRGEVARAAVEILRCVSP